MVELVDAADSKSAGFTPLRVQVSLPVPENIRRLQNVAAFLLFAAYCLFQVLLEFCPCLTLQCSTKASSQGPLRGREHGLRLTPWTALKRGDHGLFAAKGRAPKETPRHAHDRRRRDPPKYRSVGGNGKNDNKNKKIRPAPCLADFEIW